jgi:hypothetical protein
MVSRATGSGDRGASKPADPIADLQRKLKTLKEEVADLTKRINLLESSSRSTTLQEPHRVGDSTGAASTSDPKEDQRREGVELNALQVPPQQPSDGQVITQDREFIFVSPGGALGKSLVAGFSETDKKNLLKGALPITISPFRAKIIQVPEGVIIPLTDINSQITSNFTIPGESHRLLSAAESIFLGCSEGGLDFLIKRGIPKDQWVRFAGGALRWIGETTKPSPDETKMVQKLLPDGTFKCIGETTQPSPDEIKIVPKLQVDSGFYLPGLPDAAVKTQYWALISAEPPRR